MHPAQLPLFLGVLCKVADEAQATVSKEIGLEVNVRKLITRSCLEIRMQDEVTI